MASPALSLTPPSIHQSSPELCDPSPDWSLEDLTEELNALSAKFYQNPAQAHASPSHLRSASCSFSCQDLSVVADFGRASRPFRLSAFDDDSDIEENDDFEVPSRETCVDSDAIGSCSQQESQSPVHATKFVEQHESCDNRIDSPTSGLSYSWELDGEHWLLRRSEASEGLMLELEHERLQRVQEEVRQRRLILEVLIEEEGVKAMTTIQKVIKEEEMKMEMAHRLDQQYLRNIAEIRDTHLSALQREHEQRSLVEERKIRKEAEARKRENLVREEKERQEKLKREAEAKKKADALLAANILRKKQAEAAAAAALQRAEAERLAKIAAEKNMQEQAIRENISSGIGVPSEPKPIISQTAADFEQTRQRKLTALLEMSQSLQMNLSLKKALKDQERTLTRLLQQVSATQEQVRTKSTNLINELGSSTYQAFAVTTFALKLMSQCEIQVSKLPSFAFALAQVVVNVSSQIPIVMDVVLATLHQVCIFTVPKYYVFRKSQFENDKAYFKLCGYKEDEGKLESTDDYVARMTAYVTLYAAITQAESNGGANPHGLKEGWAWCARLLNDLPADRLTAAALEAYLKVAGYRLYQVYSKQFMKLVHVVATQFIGNVKKQDDPDSRAVLSRLDTYIATKQYLREPDGWRMPRTDLSSSFKM